MKFFNIKTKIPTRVIIGPGLILIAALVVGFLYLRRHTPPAQVYSVTKVADTEGEAVSSGMMTVDTCAKKVSKKCCEAAETNGLVSHYAFNNCNLCNHPDCKGFEPKGDDPGISLPFKKDIVQIGV